MKKIMLILFVSVFIYSCDKSVTASFEIDNKSDEDITITFYSEGNETKHEISTKSLVLLFTDGGLGDDVSLQISDDSVIVKTISNRTIKYYNDNIDNQKSIYSEANWQKEEVSNRNYKYTFFIAEEDFNN